MPQSTLGRMKEFVSAQGRVFDLSESKTRMSVFSYGGIARKMLPLSEGTSFTALRIALDKVSGRNGQRKVGSVLKAVKDIIANKKDGFRGSATTVVVVLIAGRDIISSVAELTRESEELLRIGVILIAIGVGPNVKARDVEAIGIRTQNIVFTEPDDSILDLISNISRILGKTSKQSERVDVAFIMGVGKPGEYHQFELGKRLMIEIVKQLSVSSEATRIGLIVYGRNARIMLPLNQGLTRGKLIKSIAELSVPEGQNGLGRALDLTRSSLFTKENGRRSGVPKTVMMFLTSGADQAARLASKRLIEDGVKLKAIGLSNSVPLESVNSLSSTPKDAVIVGSESDVGDVAGRMTDTLLPGAS